MSSTTARIIAAVAAASAIGCSGTVVVRPVPESVAEGRKVPLDGVLYALPFTVVTVTVPVVRTHSTRGRYAEYIDLFLPEVYASREYVTADSATTFAIGKPVFGTYGEPDLSRLYFVKLTGGATADRVAGLTFTERGTVSGVKAGAESYLGEITVAAVGAITGIVTRRMTLSAEAARVPARKSSACANDPVVGDSAVLAFLRNGGAPEVQDTYCRMDHTRRNEIVRAVASARDQSDPSIRDALKSYLGIRELVRSRRRLITQGDLGAALPSLELMLREIDSALALETGILFTGRRTSLTWSAGFELRPRAVTEPPTEVLRYDGSKGICWFLKQRAQGEPPPGFMAGARCDDAAAKTLRVRFEIDSQPQIYQRVLSVFASDEAGERSLRYRIPARTITAIEQLTGYGSGNGSADGSAKGSAKGSATADATALLSIGQFGVVASLPSSSGGRALNYELQFFEATGALRSFALASKAGVQAGTVNSLSNSANALIEARMDTLAKLERQRRILEEEAKIKALCVELGVTC